MSDGLLIVVGLLAFIALAGVGIVVAGVGGGGAQTSKRAQAVVRRQGDRGKGDQGKNGENAQRNQASDITQRRKQIVRSLKEQEKQRRAAAFDVASKLRQAGLSITLKTFWIIAGGVGLTLAILALVLQRNPLVALMVGFVGGCGLPFWVVGFLAKRRRAKFGAGFADAVDIIVRGLRSGLPLHDCLKVIGRECTEPLAGEFRRLIEGQALGVTLDQGLERMYERIPTPELRFFAIVLNIQQKTGGNLGEALGNLSTVLRGRRMMREKIKALSSEAVSSAAVIGCLPPGVGILITLTDPHYLSIMFDDPRGHMLLLAAAVTMAFGIFVMRKMINFKF